MKKVVLGVLIGILIGAGSLSYAADVKFSAIQANFTSTIFGKAFKPAKPIVTINNEVYVPLKLLSSALGVKCNIDTKAKKITIGEASKSTLIEFSNFTMKESSGYTTFEGEVKNNDVKDHSALIKVSFYDSSKKLLGTADGSVRDLGPGETKTFSAMASEDYTGAASYKVQVDSLY